MLNNWIQQYRFNRKRRDIGHIYSHLKKLGPEPYVMPFWRNVNKKIEAAFLPVPQSDFLNVQAIKDTMFVNGDRIWLNSQVDFLQRKLGAHFKEISKESTIGRPALLPKPLDFTTHNKIHHLYHIFFYLQTVDRKIDNISKVIEWGGGYGNMAALWYKLKKSKTTYILIDTALFCTIQWLYLASTLGAGKINLLTNKRDKVVDGKINIVPLGLLDITIITGDLFVSTWGLSESSEQAQDYVVKQKKWFGCPYLLLGYQDKTKELLYASRLGDLAKKDGARITDIEFIPHNHYAFR